MPKWGRMAWAIKRQQPQAIYDEMARMAARMRSKNS